MICEGYIIMKKKSGFAWGQFLKSVAAIAIPVALQNMLTTTGTMVDTMMIAPLGENYVGSVGLCAQFTSLMFSCYWGFVGGGMLFYAQYWGAKDDDGIDRSYGITTVCMMFVAIVFAIAAILFPEKVMSIYTDKTALQEIGVQYLRVVGFAWPFQIFSMAMSTLMRSTDRVRIPLYASIVSVSSNIFLNWVLIGGHLGAPAMGVKGAALATVCAAAINAGFCLLAAAMSKYKYLFELRKHFDWTREHLGKYFRKCLPIICNELFLGIGNALISIILGRQSEEAIAAIAVFRTLEGLVIGFFAGFSSASSVLAGHSVGAGEPERAMEYAKRIVYLCSGAIFIVCAGLYFLRGTYMPLMGLSGKSFEYGSQLILIYWFAATIRMGNWTQNDTFRSAGDAIFGTILEIIFMYALVLPMVYLTGIRWKMPLAVIFACCLCDEPIRYILLQLHLYSGKWIKPVTEVGKKALEEYNARKKAKKSEAAE